MYFVWLMAFVLNSCGVLYFVMYFMHLKYRHLENVLLIT